jgi:micrococcal nuclease
MRLLLPVVAQAAVPAEAQPQGFLGYVTRVVSGDGAYIEAGGRIEMVRYIGINTPEIQHPTRGAELYREAAREANRRLVEGRWVTLVLDTQPRDRYGRLLAYVYVGDRLVNAALAHQGYAEATTYPPNVRHRDYLVNLEQEAWTALRGLWADREARTYHHPRRDQEDSVERAGQGLVWSGPLRARAELTPGRVGGPAPGYPRSASCSGSSPTSSAISFVGSSSPSPFRAGPSRVSSSSCSRPGRLRLSLGTPGTSSSRWPKVT